MPAAFELDAQRVEEARHRVLARRIAGARGHPRAPGEAGDADDQSLRLAQERQRVVRAVHRAHVVHLHDALEDRHVLHVLEARPHRGAGVVHERVEAPERGDRARHDGLAIALDCDVGAHGHHFRATLAALRGDAFQLLLAARREHELRALRCELARELGADAFRRSGNGDRLDRSSAFPWLSAWWTGGCLDGRIIGGLPAPSITKCALPLDRLSRLHWGLPVPLAALSLLGCPRARRPRFHVATSGATRTAKGK